MLGAISLSNNKYTGCGISFSSKIYPHKDSGKNAKNLTNYGVDLSSLSHTENEKNNILVLGKGSVKIIKTTTIQTEDELKKIA